MRGVGTIDPGWGITPVRIAMGLILFLAGWGKLTGEGGLAAVAEGFGEMGIPLPGMAALFVVILEVVGGLLLLAGLAARWVGLLVALQFAYITLALKLPADGWDGARLDVLLLAAGLLLFLAGAGRLSIDEAWLAREPGHPGPGGSRRAV